MRNRIFVVGCSRSGTTVVQRSLAAHSGLTSFPETNFLNKAIGGRHGRLRARLGLIRPDRRRHAFRQLAETLGRPGVAALGQWRLTPRQSIERFVAVLDEVAAERGADGWVEKTPKHFRYVDLLRQASPGVSFVHVVRDGRDVVASIIDRARRYPGFTQQLEPQAAAALWNDALRVALRGAGRPGHVVLAYEDLVHAPASELRRVCAELGLAYEDAMVDSSDVSEIVTADEIWKAGARRPIEQRPSKFNELLTADERHVVLERLDWGRYRRLFPAGVGTERSGRGPSPAANAP